MSGNDIVNVIFGIFVLGIFYAAWMFHVAEKAAFERQSREAEKRLEGLNASQPSGTHPPGLRQSSDVLKGSNGSSRPKGGGGIDRETKNDWMPEWVNEVAKQELEKIMNKGAAPHREGEG